ncbi:MAG: D-alanine--D-alanine ligase [Proteobacteria bacterium]|nr:D-alanine--D-alanine ligase [Pseudomonadota bacterium]
MTNRLRVAVLFGGRSVEHEISVISALQLMLAVDPAKFDLIPVYITPNGSWYIGAALLERSFYAKALENLAQLEEVTLLPKPGVGGLTRLGARGLSSVIEVDLFLPAFHGQYGEDGCIQGLFEMAQVPYTGSDLPSSAITMNKYLCKMYLSAHGIPVLPASIVHRNEAQADIKQVVSGLLSQDKFKHFPLFIKPCNLGSSIGVSRVNDATELAAALAKVFRYDTQALVEPCVSKIMEINVSVRAQLGIESGIEASVVEIPVSESGTLSYEEKYLRDGGKKSGRSQGMASLTRVIDPADLDSELRNQVIELAKRSFSLLGCSGVARLDFIVDLATNKLYFNELNAFPGSCAFYLWARSKPRVLYTQLIEDMINAALGRFATNAALDRDIGLRALK